MNKYVIHKHWYRYLHLILTQKKKNLRTLILNGFSILTAGFFQLKQKASIILLVIIG